MSEFPTIEKKRDSVAIVGFAGTTRHLAPYDDPKWEIWSLNEAHRQPWMKRITRWFQIHQKWDFTKQNNQSYKEHWEWLRREHPFPIYMQEKYDEVPSSVEFPLDQISGEFLYNVRRGTELGGIDKDTELNKYFTSSFAFMCSLALLEGFKNIAVFGFEMATDTEYRYQKGSTEYWLGIATAVCKARGGQLFLPKDCRLINGALYGYEVSRMINRQRLEFLEGRFEHELKLAHSKQNQVNGRRQEVDHLFNATKNEQEKRVYATRSRQLLEEEVAANALTNERAGRVHMLSDLVKIIDNMHAGRDPGDGFFGPDGDLDPELEAQAQEKAEAQQAEEASAEVELGPSEG